MKFRVVMFMLGLLLTVVLPLSAQGNVLSYSWEAGDLALVYPSDWEAPLSAESETELTLYLAQALVDTPDTRPPGIPFITLTIIFPTDSEEEELPNLDALLQVAMQEIGIQSNALQPTTLLDARGVMTSGTSADGLLYGLGRVAQLPDDSILLVTGRGLTDQQDDFAYTFDTVVNSLVVGASLAPALPEYGVMWYTERTQSDGDNSFLELGAMAYGPDDMLYVLDASRGVIQVDAQSGMEQAQIPYAGLATPSDIAIGQDGRIFVADTLCQCVQVYNPAIGLWLMAYDNFGEEAPISIAVGLDGTVFITDWDAETDQVSLRIDRAGTLETLVLDELFDQPLLTVDRGGNLLLVAEDGTVYQLEDGSIIPAFVLVDTPVFVVDVTVDANNNLVLLSQDEGVLILDHNGDVVDYVGQVVEEFPLPGELVNPTGVAVGPDGTIYWADVDATSASLTAMSTRIEPGRVGLTQLQPNQPVQGSLDETTPSQRWSFTGTAGSRITISAVDAYETDSFNVALRLLAPDGREEAYNDDHESEDLPGEWDAQIADYTLPRDGTYTIVVERVDNEDGTYNLGLAQDHPLTLAAAGNTVIQGMLSNVFPKDRWVFDGQAGQVLTITMNAESDTLDSYLRLVDANGTLIAENDDADDTELGSDAQLVEVRLPLNGKYTIEAARFVGEGRYQLVIAPVE